MRNSPKTTEEEGVRSQDEPTPGFMSRAPEMAI